MDKRSLLLFFVFSISILVSGQRIDYTKYVNAFIGIDGTGHTFPGPCLSFGLVQKYSQSHLFHRK